MVRLSVDGDRLHFDIEGWDKLWAFKSHLDIPLAHVVAARVDPEPARGWWHGFRLPGSEIPGVLTAGTFHQHDGAVFYDVHDPDRTIVIELDHERFARLVVEVEAPLTAVSMIESAIRKAQGGEQQSS